MRPDRARVAETREWLVRAMIDLQAARLDLTAGASLTADTLFHCQQAVEKSWKAFLAWHDQPFRKTHNLSEIGRQCMSIDPSLGSLVQQGAGLTEYAWKFRYPGEPAEPPVSEAQEGLALAQDIYRAIASRLPAEATPQ